MKKKLVVVWILLVIFSSGNTFWWNAFNFWSNNQQNPSWIYNPVSGFYELKNKNIFQMEVTANMDFYWNNSFQKFLDDKHPLSTNKISDIVKINSDFTTNKSSDFSLRKEAAEAFEKMAWAFSNAFDYKAKLTINSAWRSQNYQRKLSSNCSNIRCAKPWTSEHEAGLALDLWVNWWNINALNGKYYQWLKDNAHLYGFHNTYQKWMDIDWKMIEPRHWRYVWVDLATLLHDHNQTFAEFFYENIEKSYKF